MKKKELCKRYALFIVSSFVSAFGIACTKAGNLGVSAISSVPNVLSVRFEALTIGNWTFLWNLAMIAAQIAILRKDFQKRELLQIPMSFLFGWFTDIGVQIVSVVPVNSYPMQLVMVVAGICILAFGITLGITANVILNSGEAIVKAIAFKTKKEFSSVKVLYDTGCIITAVLLSLVLFGGKIRGIREGTLIAAFLNGTMVKVYSRRIKEPLNRRLSV